MLPGKLFKSWRRRGFSLVEVVLALGITTVGIFAVFGVMQVGLHANQDSAQESQAIALIQSMIADRRSAPTTKFSPVYGIPPIGGGPPTTFFVTEDGTRTPTADGARFRIKISQESPSGTATAPMPTYLLFHASWPAQAPASTSWVEIVAAFPTL